MADSVLVSSLFRAVYNGESIDIDRLINPATIALSADDYAYQRLELPTATAVAHGTIGLVNIFVPTATTRIGWYAYDGSGSEVTTDSSGLVIPANFPFVMGSQAHEYNATLATRLALTESDIKSFYFYQASGSTTYVDVYSVS